VEDKQMLTVKELQALDPKDLSELQAKVGLALRNALERKRDAVKAMLETEARAAGFTMADVLMAPRRRARRPAFKYVNPKDPDETWAGHGRRPAWLAAQLKAGKPLERFLSH
jgi:DNA-binding protein H-NS